MKTRTLLLYQCQFCQEEVPKKKLLIEHENNIHSPRWNKDETIHLSGGDQVILLLKSTFHSWDYYHKSHSKNTHISFKDGGKRLEQWEKDNGVEFVVCGDKVVSYGTTNPRKLKTALQMFTGVMQN